MPSLRSFPPYLHHPDGVRVVLRHAAVHGAPHRRDVLRRAVGRPHLVEGVAVVDVVGAEHGGLLGQEHGAWTNHR